MGAISQGVNRPMSRKKRGGTRGGTGHILSLDPRKEKKKKGGVCKEEGSEYDRKAPQVEEEIQRGERDYCKICGEDGHISNEETHLNTKKDQEGEEGEEPSSIVRGREKIDAAFLYSSAAGGTGKSREGILLQQAVHKGGDEKKSTTFHLVGGKTLHQADQ